MKYIINKKEIDSTDVSGIVEEISILKKNQTNANVIPVLIQILDHTDNYKLIDTIALIFADLNSDLALQTMVEKLGKIKDSNHTSTLIYACSEYDCAKYILFFSDLLINYDYHTMLECFSIIRAIKDPIKLSDKIAVTKNLSDSLLNLNEGDDKLHIINDALQYVRDMKVNDTDD